MNSPLIEGFAAAFRHTDKPVTRRTTPNTLAARELGVHPVTLASYRKLGCPLGDIAAARAWIDGPLGTLKMLRGGEP